MLKIRLQRTGRINRPSYRIVVTESHNGPQSGKSLEVIGSFDPRAGKPVIDADRVKHWIARGAGVSDTMHNMLISAGIIEGKKKNALPKRTPTLKEGAAPAENKEGAAVPAAA